MATPLDPGAGLIYQLYGADDEGGYIDLQSLVSSLEALKKLLNVSQRLEAGEGRKLFYRIKDIRRSNPYEVLIEPVEVRSPRTRKPPLDTRRIVRRAVSTMDRAVRERRAPVNEDPDLVDAVQQLIAPIGKRIAQAKLHSEGLDVTISAAVGAEIQRSLAVASQELGSVTGRLLALDFFAGLHFAIHPEVGPHRVTCRFAPELEPKVVAALKRRVEVYGLLRFREDAAFPHEVEVQTLEELPDDAPSLASLRGTALDATGGIPAEEFIRKLRDEW